MLKYVLLSDELCKQSAKRLLLKLLDKDEAMRLMEKFYKGIFGSGRSSPKMRWLIHRHEYY